ncbi:MAG: hypothetical protein NTW19_20390 [Planctomycetota bacterium]|nr:hypothetical protein [Planctomycetota bacterium]
MRKQLLLVGVAVLVFAAAMLGFVFLLSSIATGLRAHPTGKIVATRVDANGAVVEQLMREESHSETFIPIGPHGSSKRVSNYKCKYFLVVPGQPRPVNPILEARGDQWQDVEYGVGWMPVQGAPKWVMAGFDNDLKRSGHFVNIKILDGSGQVLSRQYPYVPDWTNSEPSYRFENGNHNVVFRTSGGFDSYDVVTDSVAPWKKP